MRSAYASLLLLRRRLYKQKQHVQDDFIWLTTKKRSIHTKKTGTFHIVSMDTSAVFMDHDIDDDDCTYEQAMEREFIWTGYVFSDNGDWVVVHGCFWGGPYTSELFDIRSLSSGCKFVSMDELFPGIKPMLGVRDDEQKNVVFDYVFCGNILNVLSEGSVICSVDVVAALAKQKVLKQIYVLNKKSK